MHDEDSGSEDDFDDENLEGSGSEDDLADEYFEDDPEAQADEEA